MIFFYHHPSSCWWKASYFNIPKGYTGRQEKLWANLPMDDEMQ